MIVRGAPCEGHTVDKRRPFRGGLALRQHLPRLHERVECCREVADLFGVVGLEVTRGQGESGDGDVQFVEVHARRYPPSRAIIPIGAAA